MKETIIEARTSFLAPLAALLLLPSACGPAKPTVNGNDAVVEGCGDGVAVGWEECDLGDLRSADCTTLGLAGGTLSCGLSCAYDTSGCHGCSNGLCDAGEDRSSCPEDCGARQVTGGQLASCALMGTGNAYCWGVGASGMIGDGTFTTNSLPSKVAGGIVHRELAAGSGHVCSLSTTGQAYCWGDNWSLGAPGLDDSPVPRLVEGLPAVAALSSAYGGACVLGLLGEVLCWGPPYISTRSEDLYPGPVQGLTGAMRMVSCGGMHCCALSVTDDLWCWGRNENGVLGVTTPTEVSVALLVFVGLEPRQLSGGNNHHCLVDLEGRVHCWGDNFHGQCARPRSSEPFLTPVEISLPEPATKVAAGMQHTCALLESGKVHCWGAVSLMDDYRGQLGIGQTFNGSHDPMEALVPVPSRDLEAGEFHNCVATRDGRVFCWGDNSNGAVDPVAHEGERHLPGEVSIPPE